MVAEDEWCIGGDFNSVLNKDERIGRSSSSSYMDCENFQNFVEEMEIIDLLFMGGRYTWFSENGLAMGRLDRFLLSDNLISLWKFDNQVVGKRVLSDHNLV